MRVLFSSTIRPHQHTQTQTHIGTWELWKIWGKSNAGWEIAGKKLNNSKRIDINPSEKWNIERENKLNPRYECHGEHTQYEKQPTIWRNPLFSLFRLAPCMFTLPHMVSCVYTVPFVARFGVHNISHRTAQVICSLRKCRESSSRQYKWDFAMERQTNEWNPNEKWLQMRNNVQSNCCSLS